MSNDHFGKKNYKTYQKGVFRIYWNKNHNSYFHCYHIIYIIRWSSCFFLLHCVCLNAFSLGSNNVWLMFKGCSHTDTNTSTYSYIHTHTYKSHTCSFSQLHGEFREAAAVQTFDPSVVDRSTLYPGLTETYTLCNPVESNSTHLRTRTRSVLGLGNDKKTQNLQLNPHLFVL